MARASFAKVAEYQGRGVIHYHAVFRIDGPEGPTSEPPSWATVEVLEDCLRKAAKAVFVNVPDPAASETATRTLRFGTQLDVKPVNERADDLYEPALTSRAVANYVAKYVTKSTEDTHTPPRRIKPQDLYWLHLPPHTERMIRTCFELAEKPAYRELLLARWAHMLGYRGHATTKSRSYSTTYGQIRDDRRVYREAERRERDGRPEWDDRRATVVNAEWRFLWTGLVHGEDIIVEAIRRSQGIAAEIRSRDTGDAA